MMAASSIAMVLVGLCETKISILLFFYCFF